MLWSVITQSYRPFFHLHTAALLRRPRDREIMSVEADIRRSLKKYAPETPWIATKVQYVNSDKSVYNLTNWQAVSWMLVLKRVLRCGSFMWTAKLNALGWHYYTTVRDWVENFPDMDYSTDYTISKAGTNIVIVCPCACHGELSAVWSVRCNHNVATSGAIADTHSAKRVLLLLLDKQIYTSQVFLLGYCLWYSYVPTMWWGWMQCWWCIVVGKMWVDSMPHHVSYVDSTHVTNTMSVPQKTRIFRPLLATDAGHVLDVSI
jgi:hypothetical protein